MKLNLKSTIAAPTGNNSCQKALNGIIGNTRRGIVVDKTLNPDSNNPIANKPVSTALAALAGKIDATLQKPTGLTKTKLVGVGASGQENIEIGDNLTLANGKLSATGGGGGDAFDSIVISDDTSYTGTFTGTKPVLVTVDGVTNLFLQYFIQQDGTRIAELKDINGAITRTLTLENNTYSLSIKYLYYYHFITITKSNDNIVLYLTIQNTSDDIFYAGTLSSYLTNKKILVNGNLHGSVPTYIVREGGKIKVYYMIPGDNNINPEPDVFSDLSSFTISDLVSPVE